MAAAVGLVLAAPAGAQAPVKAVASFSILGDMVKAVGGSRVAVATLVGPDGDAHVFQPAPGDARAVADSKVVFVNGLGFEGWMERLAQSAGFKGAVVAAATGIQPRQMKDDKAAIDPHAWQDLRNALVYADNIEKGLSAADPAGAAAYKANAAAYKKQIQELDAWVRAEIAAVPKARRKVVTSHDAFGYFASAYGVQFLAPAGVSTDAEPSAKGVAALIRQIKREAITALFVENITNPKLVEQIGKETGVKPGPRLYSDALSKPGGPADTYVKMFRHNVSTLKSAMLGRTS
ncbi:MAG: metal ABC transporter solute-binding protein, Zn/Mn family [Rhodospirillales bacterium]